ncbi:hypothetical protein ILP97_51855 [Amycolatopsis sp. H6(2020)]|nr:hypothetical protein [Amycolatopsis sp. H6(2020)]
MSLEYEAWCASEPNLGAVARTASLVMSLVLDVDDRAVTVSEHADAWHLSWDDSVFVVVDVSGPELAEIAGRWTLAAEAGRRGEALDELLSLVVVAAAATVHGGEVVDEPHRLSKRIMDPKELVLALARVGSRDPRSLVNGVRVGRGGRPGL